MGYGRWSQQVSVEGVVILGFRSKLKNDYRRWFKRPTERDQSEAKRSKEVVKRGLPKGLGKEKNAVKGGLGRIGEVKFKMGTVRQWVHKNVRIQERGCSRRTTTKRLP